MPAAPHTPAEFREQAKAVVAAQRAENERIDAEIWAGRGWNLPRRYDLEAGTELSIRPKVETVEEIADRLCREANRRAIFRASPRGRLLSAIEALEGEGYGVEALRGCYARLYYSGFGKPGEPVQLHEAAAALKLLAPIDSRAAQDAEVALADLLDEAAQLVKAAA